MDNIKTSDGSIPNCIDFNSCKIISWFSIPKSPPDGKYPKEQTEKSTTILYAFSKPFVEVSINLY